ncbi:TIR domain-containing protein [Rhizobium grahamii]|uniref:Thoeris protein ThsB TIR-like domain-containing protein n=1 Tax=Rhizobium grahamii CCGE 502 TaxID=990285 RepID=S3HK48_9HYPH|nr:TIR domain-containing protein [Rhizobium grahamii]EPE98430.1 hypothetical protein RGCCGE502_08385 [Rhizobium grahamii CCGE 502]
MARKVFFSFHYQRDVMRVMQVRNSWVVRSKGEATPFYDKAEFEQVKKKAGGIERWIEEQMNGTSVTVVLYGRETFDRPWVLHEIRRSYELGKGLIAIAIHNVKDPRNGTDYAGKNPLSYFTTTRNGVKFDLSQLYPSYDWVNNDGYTNLPAWIESAAKAAGK